MTWKYTGFKLVLFQLYQKHIRVFHSFTTFSTYFFLSWLFLSSRLPELRSSLLYFEPSLTTNIIGMYLWDKTNYPKVYILNEKETHSKLGVETIVFSPSPTFFLPVQTKNYETNPTTPLVSHRNSRVVPLLWIFPSPSLTPSSTKLRLLGLLY